MSKYVIELRPDCKVVQQICESDGQLYIGSKSLNYFEELNSDYINEHYGELQDTAYQRGLHEGNDIGYKDGVNDGRNEAWEAARKIVLSPDEGGTSLPDLFAMFGKGSMQSVFRSYSASEAIAKLKGYEEKQKADNKIKVSDEVVWTEDENVVIVVTCVYTENNMEWCDGFCRDGKVYQILTEHARKTGRHFDIASILEDMRND